MKLKTSLDIFILLCLCAVCCLAPSVSAQSAGQAATAAPAAPPAVGAYVIQPNDVLTVFVYNHTELSQKVTVQPDGLISTPLAQSIQASGLTPAQLKVAIEKHLQEGDLIAVPNVTVTLDAIQSYRIYVIGKVQKPGILAYEKPLTVLQALAMAGGFQDYAKKKEITIVRTTAPQGANPQKEKQFSFNYEEVLKGTKATQNIYLESGDVVVIN